MVLQIWWSQWDFPGFLKFLLICLVTLVLLLPVYDWLIRYTIVGRVLNGRRMRPDPK